MNSRTKSVLKMAAPALVALLLVSALRLPSTYADNAPPPAKLRLYYLTSTETFDGLTAPTACALGFHMASIWEILDPSNLRYNTTLGFNQDDSGQGPPANGGSNSIGWVRTGGISISAPIPGLSNCAAYTTNDVNAAGTTAALVGGAAATATSPYELDLIGCVSKVRVWCVQN